MIFVDSSVWIDWLRETNTPQTAWLAQVPTDTRLVVGDLVLAEVLQGAKSDRQFTHVSRWLLSFTLVQVAGIEIAARAAENFRKLRALGHTPRSNVDTLIATRCIAENWPLLASDRDFEPFAN